MQHYGIAQAVLNAGVLERGGCSQAPVPSSRAAGRPVPESVSFPPSPQVRKHINDLYEDLRDGHNLISLLEVLSGVKLPREKGRMRFHRLQNVQIALDFLKQRQVKLVNIRNDDITDGNPKLTLGLIWTIILHFQVKLVNIRNDDITDGNPKLTLGLIWTIILHFQCSNYLIFGERTLQPIRAPSAFRSSDF
nr:PREDICTED: microtubule-actin cross-linking factor 1-like [Apteryx mantelli mantelli]